MVKGVSLVVIALGAAALSRAAAAAEPPAGPDGEDLECPRADGAPESTRKARAAEHYDRGALLFADGEYQRAIPEFRAAYCLARIPDAVVSIAKCYQQLIDYENAVRWFEEYVRLIPDRPDEGTRIGYRVAVLRRQPARIRVATDPPNARVILLQQGKVVTRGEANRDPIEVAAGNYTLRAERDGYRTESIELEAKIGQPYTFILTLAPKTGALRVKAHPSDARIFIDDKIAGIGSLDEQVRIGRHTVRVEATGRPTEVRDVVLGDDRAITLQVTMKPPRPLNGRYELLIISTITGVLEGLALGIAGSDSENAAPIVGAGVGGAAVGFLTPYLLAPRYVPVGRTSTVIGMSFAGAFQGAMLGSLVADKDVDEDLVENRVSVSIAVGASIAFNAGAWLATETVDMSAGDAALLNSGALAGAAAGVLLAIGLDEDRRPMLQSLALAGINVGLVGGALLGAHFEYSREHVALIDLSGLVGLSSGGAIAWFASGDREQTALVALGGMALGLVGGGFVTRNMDLEPELAPFVETTEDVAGNDVTTVGISATW